MRTIAVFLACMLTLQAEAGPERIRWSQTPEILAGRHLLVQLAGGETLEGNWIGVTADTFTMRVDNPPRNKGPQTFSRSSILQVRAGNKRIRGRVIGVLAGVYGVAAIAGAATRSPEALQGGWGVAAIAGGVAGYFVGRSVDRATHEIVLLP